MPLGVCLLSVVLGVVCVHIPVGMYESAHVRVCTCRWRSEVDKRGPLPEHELHSGWPASFRELPRLPTHICQTSGVRPQVLGPQVPSLSEQSLKLFFGSMRQGLAPTQADPQFDMNLPLWCVLIELS